MRTLLPLLVFASLAVGSKSFKCFVCVASNEEDCFKQGSQVCPGHTDGCSTIMAQNSIIKSCTYTAFCERARQNGGGGASVECCYTDDCNGPAKGSHAGLKNSAATLNLHPFLMVLVLSGKLLLSSL